MATRRGTSEPVRSSRTDDDDQFGTLGTCTLDSSPMDHGPYNCLFSVLQNTLLEVNNIRG